MFHISTGLDGGPKKIYTKKYTAESSKQLKAWRADSKANRNVFSEIKLQFPRFLDIKINIIKDHCLNWLLITFFAPEAITFCSGGKRRTGDFQTAMILRLYVHIHICF